MKTETVQFYCDICRCEIPKDEVRAIQMYKPGAIGAIYQAEHVCGACFESTLLYISQLPKGAKK